MRLKWGACASLLGWVLARPAWGFQNDQREFARLHFGQTAQQAQKLYPKLQKLDKERFAAAFPYGPLFPRYYRPDVKLPGLPHPVALELRFFKEELWVIVAYFGDNSNEQILAFLNKRYGPP